MANVNIVVWLWTTAKQTCRPMRSRNRCLRRTNYIKSIGHLGQRPDTFFGCTKPPLMSVASSFFFLLPPIAYLFWKLGFRHVTDDVNQRERLFLLNVSIVWCEEWPFVMPMNRGRLGWFRTLSNVIYSCNSDEEWPGFLLRVFYSLFRVVEIPGTLLKKHTHTPGINSELIDIHLMRTNGQKGGWRVRWRFVS